MFRYFHWMFPMACILASAAGCTASSDEEPLEGESNAVFGSKAFEFTDALSQCAEDQNIIGKYRLTNQAFVAETSVSIELRGSWTLPTRQSQISLPPRGSVDLGVDFEGADTSPEVTFRATTPRIGGGISAERIGFYCIPAEGWQRHPPPTQVCTHEDIPLPDGYQCDIHQFPFGSLGVGNGNLEPVEFGYSPATLPPSTASQTINLEGPHTSVAIAPVTEVWNGQVWVVTPPEAEERCVTVSVNNFACCNSVIDRDLGRCNATNDPGFFANNAWFSWYPPLEP